MDDLHFRQTESVESRNEQQPPLSDALMYFLLLNNTDKNFIYFIHNEIFLVCFYVVISAFCFKVAH